jgi:hypothetical protein
MVVRSALTTGHPLPPGKFLVLISVRGWVEPAAIMQLEVLGQPKNAMTSWGIEPATLRQHSASTNYTTACPWTEPSQWLKNQSVDSLEQVCSSCEKPFLSICLTLTQMLFIVKWNYFRNARWACALAKGNHLTTTCKQDELTASSNTRQQHTPAGTHLCTTSSCKPDTFHRSGFWTVRWRLQYSSSRSPNCTMCGLMNR